MWRSIAHYGSLLSFVVVVVVLVKLLLLQLGWCNLQVLVSCVSLRVVPASCFLFFSVSAFIVIDLVPRLA